MNLILTVIVVLASGAATKLYLNGISSPLATAVFSAVIMGIGMFWVLPGTGWAGEEKMPVLILTFISFIFPQFWGLISRRIYKARTKVC